MEKVKVGFDPLRPDEAIKFIKSKGLEISYDYDEMSFEAHNKAFTVAKIMKTDLLKDMHDAVAKSIEDGTPFETFQKNIKPTLQKKGWWGTQEIVNPKTGEVKEIYIGSRRLKNIYHTNKRVSQSQGRWKQQSGFKKYVYLRYVAKQYGNRRELHQAAHGTVKHRDDAWWDVNYPVNGYGCGCTTVAYSKEQLKKRGFEVSEGKSANIADKGWEHHTGKSDKVQDVYKQKVQDLAKPCKENNALNQGGQARTKRCHDSLAKVAQANYTKDIKTLAQRVATYKAVKELFADEPKKSVELCQSDIFGEKKSVYISHDTVQSHLHRSDISAFHYSLIPQMLEGKKRVFVQKENTYVVVKKLGSVYRIALKNIDGKSEIFVTSLLNLSSNIAKELRKLSKFREVEE